ncbi:MAG: hypothetical protein ACYTDY_17250 [Planctomycetota bacterium]|jgi:hypothetical protein
MQRTAIVVLSSLVVLAGLWVVLTGEEHTSSPPMVHVDQGAVHAGGEVTGCGVDPEGGDVTVRAFIDGEEIDGSPDEIMDGPMNEFCFDVPEGSEGKVMEIVVEDESGGTSSTFVPIM